MSLHQEKGAGAGPRSKRSVRMSRGDVDLERSARRDPRLWEVEARAAVIRRRGATSVTFGDYAERWLAGFIDDAPDRARLEAALEHRLLPVLGEWPLPEVLAAARDELDRRVVDAGADGDEAPCGRVCS